LWFFGGYTPTVENTKRTVTFVRTTTPVPYTSDENTHNVSGKITSQITRGLRLTGSGDYTRYKQDGRLPNKNGTSNAATNFAALGRIQPNTGATLMADYVANSRLFFNAKTFMLDYNTKDTGIPADIWYTFTGSNAAFPGATDVRPAGYNSVLTNSASVKDRYQRMGASADATYYASFAGQHTFKGGVQFERIRNDVFSAEQAPHITFNWDATHTNLDGTIVRGQYGTYSWRQFGTIGDVHVNNLGFFIQDAWTVNNKLTINAGVRTEREDIPSYVEGLNGIKFSFADKFAPRLGFAYDLKGDGRTKVYGSWGVYYDIMKLELPRGAFGGDKWIEHYYTLDTLDWTSIGPNDNFPGTFLEDVNFRIPSNDPSCPECGAIDPNLKPMRQQEAQFGMQHELRPTLSFGARYVHKQVDRAIEDIGIITPGIGEVFNIANPGEGVAQFILGDECPTCPALPKAKRDYDAMELTLTKRFSNRWQGQASYTFSRLYGNYPGLASSDENGRSDPSVERFFDGLYMSFDENGNPVYGPLGTDRPHYFKMQATYQLPWGTGIGLNQDLASGTPQSSTITFKSVPFFPYGRGDLGRSPVYSNTDLSLYHRLHLRGRSELDLYLNVFNLFDQDTVMRLFTTRYRDQLPGLTDAGFFQGFDEQALVTANGKVRPDPRFGLPDQFRGGRTMRVQAKISF